MRRHQSDASQVGRLWSRSFIRMACRGDPVRTIQEPTQLPVEHILRPSSFSPPTPTSRPSSVLVSQRRQHLFPCFPYLPTSPHRVLGGKGKSSNVDRPHTCRQDLATPVNAMMHPTDPVKPFPYGLVFDIDNLYAFAASHINPSNRPSRSNTLQRNVAISPTKCTLCNVLYVTHSS